MISDLVRSMHFGPCFATQLYKCRDKATVWFSSHRTLSLLIRSAFKILCTSEWKVVPSYGLDGTQFQSR